MLAAATAGAPQVAIVRAWPARRVRLVVPGATDIIGWLVTECLAERPDQPAVIDNRPGAGTTIGAAAVARAAADGYTPPLAPTPFVISQVMYADLPFDGRKDFAPASTPCTCPACAAARQSSTSCRARSR